MTRKNSDNKQILLEHLNGISYRKMELRFNVHKRKICKTVNEQLSKFKNNFEITKHFLNQLTYIGNHVADGKYIPVKKEIMENVSGKIPRSKKRRKVKKGMVLVWGADYTNHDIPHFEFGESENDFIFDNYFSKLKLIGYPMKSLTVDDKHEIIQAAKRYYPDCIFQLCIRHYLTKISKKLATANIRIKIKARQKQLDKLFVNSDEDYSYIPPSRPVSILKAVKLSNEISNFEFKHELLLDFQDILISILYAKNYRIALYRIKYLENIFWRKIFQMQKSFHKKHINLVWKLIEDFKEHQKYLLNYLKYPRLNIPSTTNLIEGYNSQFELRLSSIRGFETPETAKNYVNAWIIKRRFSKFTDCKNHFKELNGKTPLECAGADISNIHNWIKWSDKK